MSDVYGFFDSFLETAASLAVLFIVVAWVSSKIVELVQLSFNFHGRVLRSELERCFGEDGGETRGRFTRYFYWHPMVVPLTQPSPLVNLWRKVRASRWWPRPGGGGEAGGAIDADPCYPPGRLPAHIAPETFAAVVMNPFPWPTTVEPLRRLLEANLSKWTPHEQSSDSNLASSEAPQDEHSLPQDDAVRALAKLLIREARSVRRGETWEELLARSAVKNEAAELGTFVFNEDFRDAGVDPAGAPAEVTELLRRKLRRNADMSIGDYHLLELARDIAEEPPRPRESWQDVFIRLGIAGAPGFSPEFLSRRARMPKPTLDPSERYIDACSRNNLVPHELETRIVTLLRDAEGDVEEFRAGLKRWYAEAMERVTGRFKRTALIMLFGVALIICAAFNLNALTIIDALIGNPELRGLGVQASRAIGDNPRGMAALSQKLQFQDFAARCEKAPPCNSYKVLEALWLDHRQPVVFADEKAFPASPPAADEIAARRRLQVATVREQCSKVSGLCSPSLTATLNRCESRANARQAATSAPAETAPAPATQTLPAPVAEAGKEDDEACSRAWSAIWRNSDFFWHPEAAHKFAADLWGGITLEPADRGELVTNLREQAAADTNAVKKYIEMLPSVGWIGWEQRKEEFLANWLWLIFGILLSAALAALGAPFWYDVLGKISGRGGGRSRGEKA